MLTVTSIDFKDKKKLTNLLGAIYCRYGEAHQKLKMAYLKDGRV